VPGQPLPEALAIRLRNDLDVRDRRFDLLELVRAMGFEVQHVPIPGGTEGLSARIDRRDLILINSEGRSDRRQRFTLAHELGHSLLGHSSACRPHEVHGHTEVPEEAAANQFAATLLMPPRLFRNDMRGLHPWVDELSSLADLYCVSRTAAALRFARFTEDACAVIGVTPERSWLFKSSSVGRWWIRMPPPPGSLIQDHLASPSAVTVAEVDAEVWLENFRRRTACRIREEIAPAGPASWLVLLSEIPDADDDPDVEEREADEDLDRRRKRFRMH
jgi:Zn-dependent peptidase ImmA (M78 family)